MQTDQLPIPALVVDCARLVNVDLSDAGSPAGSKVDWTAVNYGPANLTAPSNMDRVLDGDRTARYSYRTGQESKADSHDDKNTGSVEVTGSIERKDVERLRQLFATLVLDQIPAVIRPLVEPFARPVLDAATRLIAAISDVHETGTVCR